MKGLVIRYFMGGYFLCDGKAPEGKENDGEYYVGNSVKWFETWDEANAMRDMIDDAYGFNRGFYEMEEENKALDQEEELNSFGGRTE